MPPNEFRLSDDYWNMWYDQKRWFFVHDIDLFMSYRMADLEYFNRRFGWSIRDGEDMFIQIATEDMWV